jgi:hypothetical protein
VFFVGYEDSGSGAEPNPTLSPELGGGGEQIPYEDYEFEDDQSCDHGAAKKIGQKIAELVQSVGRYEFGTYVSRNIDGSFGAHDNKIHTNFDPGFVGMPRLNDYSSIRGTIHNHTWSSDTANDPNRNFISRYPSGRNWAGLEELVNPSNGASPADPNLLSVFITDPWGTTREFRYLDRTIYEQMTDSQRVTGENLPPPGQDCP